MFPYKSVFGDCMAYVDNFERRQIALARNYSFVFYTGK